MVIFSFCTSTTATPPSLLLLSSPHKHTSGLLVSPSASSFSSSPLAASETSSHQEFSVSPPINTLLFLLCPPTTKEEHLVYNYSTPNCLHLLSSPLIPLFLPAQSPPPPKHTSNQYGPNQEREGMPSTSHAAPAGRKKPFVIALSLSLSLFFPFSISISAFSRAPFLPSHSSNCFPSFSFFPLSLSLTFLLHIFRDEGVGGGVALFFTFPEGEWFLSPSVSLFQQSNFSSFAQHV